MAGYENNFPDQQPGTLGLEPFAKAFQLFDEAYLATQETRHQDAERLTEQSEIEMIRVKAEIAREVARTALINNRRNRR